MSGDILSADKGWANQRLVYRLPKLSEITLPQVQKRGQFEVFARLSKVDQIGPLGLDPRLEHFKEEILVYFLKS